jgi:hypothetical protein
MGHRYGKRHGQPSRREERLREELHRREHEDSEAKKLRRAKANEVSQKEET